MNFVSEARTYGKELLLPGNFSPLTHSVLDMVEQRVGR